MTHQRMIAPQAPCRRCPCPACTRRRFRPACRRRRSAPRRRTRRLPGPDLLPHVVEGRLQVVAGPARSKRRQKSPAVVGSGIRWRAKQVEIGLVLPPQFEIFQAGAAAQRVVGQVEHVVRLVIRQMDLEQMQPLVDRLGQTQLRDQLVDQPDAAVGRAARPPCQLVLRRAPADHRLREVVGIVELIEPLAANRRLRAAIRLLIISR